MPRDDDSFKEGVDFEWVQGENHNALVRRFFSAEEKKQRATPKKPKSRPKRSTGGRKPRKETPATPLRRPPKVSTKSLDPIVTGAEEALRRVDERDRMLSFEPPVKPKAKKRTPGAAIVQAIRNTVRGSGETNPGKIVRGYAKGGLVKANCGASMKPKRKK